MASLVKMMILISLVGVNTAFQLQIAWKTPSNSLRIASTAARNIFPRSSSPKMRPVRCKQSPEDDEKTWVDGLFEPIVNMYEELSKWDQSMLATIYQTAFYMLCVYVGVEMVKANKFFVAHSAGMN